LLVIIALQCIYTHCTPWLCLWADYWLIISTQYASSWIFGPNITNHHHKSTRYCSQHLMQHIYKVCHLTRS